MSTEPPLNFNRRRDIASTQCHLATNLFSNRPRTKQADAFGQRRPIEICRNSSVEPFATCETATFWPIRLTASVAREGTP